MYHLHTQWQSNVGVCAPEAVRPDARCRHCILCSHSLLQFLWPNPTLSLTTTPPSVRCAQRPFAGPSCLVDRTVKRATEQSEEMTKRRTVGTPHTPGRKERKERRRMRWCLRNAATTWTRTRSTRSYIDKKNARRKDNKDEKNVKISKACERDKNSLEYDLKRQEHLKVCILLWTFSILSLTFVLLASSLTFLKFEILIWRNANKRLLTAFIFFPLAQ